MRTSTTITTVPSDPELGRGILELTEMVSEPLPADGAALKLNANALTQQVVCYLERDAGACVYQLCDEVLSMLVDMIHHAKKWILPSR